MRKLEIRAARCLGGLFEEKGNGLYLISKSLLNSIFEHTNTFPTQSLHESNLKFTSSYDWAMWGEKVLGKDFEFIIQRGQVLMGKLGDDGDFDILYEGNIEDNLFPSPAQITEGWVTIIEDTIEIEKELRIKK